MSRIVCWFSCGAASAVATKLTLAKHADAVVVRTRIDSEHPDNDRFAAECGAWFGAPITEIRSEKYATHWDVLEKRRFISGHAGALCTVELKKIPRFAFQRADDTHVFGYTVEEGHRIDRARQQNPEMTIDCPLQRAGLTKADCLAMVARAGIELPVMYRLGFGNNNCIGCAKATSPAYWQRIRKHFPEAYDRMARVQRDIGYSQVKVADKPVYLDELPPAEVFESEPDIECSLLCAIAEDEAREVAAQRGGR